MPVPALADEPTGEIVRIDLEDAALVDRAAAGDTAAFESLYERHADAAWRVAAAVAANEHDAADAVAEAFTRVLETIRKGAAGIANFRAYLLTTTRNAALDRHRHHGRERPGDDVGIDEPADGPDAVLLDLADMSLAAAAFGDLPDRWREVLWLTEVEGLDATEVAERMGLNRNALAQLAFRARGGLRERFLHRHLGQAPRACRPVVELLAAYALHRLPERDRAKVDAHLTSCSDCRRRHDDLADMGTTLRRALIPMPASLAAATGRRFLDLVGTASPGRLRDALAASGPARVAVGACATALAVAGLLNLGGLRPSPALDVPPVSAPAETSAPPTEE
ncbi:MAG TPA: sigma-70 family RNA polymerase sigma factor, partial [Acidimicrobiia bacterium]|nr:sigma-70 family RNA polymerase sigma factor [Acidimicrobiia bacterium]